MYPWTRWRLRKALREPFRATGRRGNSFAHDWACECSPPWPSLESTANGYAMPAVKSDYYSVMTDPRLGPFVARCTGCHARYPRPWLVPTGSPMPFAWARDEPDKGGSGENSLAPTPTDSDHLPMTRQVLAEDLKVGDIVHVRTINGIDRVELTEIIQRTRGFKLVGYRVDDAHRIPGATFNTGIEFGETAEID